MNHRIDSFLKRTWVSSSTPVAPQISLQAARRTPWDHLANCALWPLAAFLIIHRVVILSVNSSITDDFSTVYFALRRFIEGVPVYNENYSYVDPHYLYNPGATLILAPLAIFGHYQIAKMLFILVNTTAIILALALLTKLVGFSWRSAILPGAIFLAFLTESVRNTLVFGNVNGVLFLIFVSYLWCVLSMRLILAGALLGLAIVIKPMFAPLLILSLMLWQWRTILSAISVPVFSNLIAWPLVPGANDYLTKTMPYLKEVRDYSNSSLQGLALYFGFPPIVTAIFFVIFAAAIAIGLICLARWRYADPTFWLISSASLLLSGVFFLSSLGQMYYSMMLIPLMFTVLLPRSCMHFISAWAAAYLMFTTDNWKSGRWPDYSRWFDYFQASLGWATLIITIATAAAFWAYREHQSVKPGALVASK